MSSALQIINSTMPTMPEGWDAKAEFIDQCLQAETRVVCWMAIAVAWTRQEFADAAQWREACTERWGWDKGYLYQLLAAGELLLRPSVRVCHDTLTGLQLDSLYYMSKLPPHLLSKFVEKARPQEHTRDEVRAAVKSWCAAAGEPTGPEPGKRQAKTLAAPVEQLDFLGALFGAAEQTVEDIAQRLARAEVGGEQAFRVLNRSLMVTDAMLPRIDRTDPERLRMIATALRDEADKADRLACGLATAKDQLTA